MFHNIYYNTSNVGIGTTNPLNKLHIYDDTIIDTKITIQNNYIDTANEIIITDTTSSIIGSRRCISFPYLGPGTSNVYSFTTTEILICDILIVGGGGGGGPTHGGGGGAGQLVFIYNATLNGTYTIKVGKGGIGGIDVNNPATKGIDSKFENVIAEGGGANSQTASDKNGGSGAGGDAYGGGGGGGGIGTANTTIDLFLGATVYSKGNNGGSDAPHWLDGEGGGGGGVQDK